MEIETRTLAAGLESGGDSSAAEATLTGYAAIFNELSVDLGGFRELLAPGAFSRAIAEDDVRALLNHDPSHLLGRTRAGTLKLAEDTRGLRVEIKLPDTQAGRDVETMVRRGDLSGMSFQFSVPKGGDVWTYQEDGTPLRTVVAVKLYDVAPVTFPAYPQTSISARNEAAQIRAGYQAAGTPEARRARQALRDAMQMRLILEHTKL